MPTSSRLGREPLRGRKLVYCTTNGTVALLTSTAAQFTHIGSLLNAQALVAHIRRAQESVTAGHCG